MAINDVDVGGGSLPRESHCGFESRATVSGFGTTVAIEVVRHPLSALLHEEVKRYWRKKSLYDLGLRSRSAPPRDMGGGLLPDQSPQPGESPWMG